MTDAWQISESFKRTVERDRKFPFIDYQEKSTNWITESTAFLENCFPSAVLVLCKIKHPTIAYVSKNSEVIIGYSSNFIREASAEEYFSLVHPDDSQAVLRLYEKMNDVMKSPGYRPENWKFCFHYRFRLKSGLYIIVTDEKAAFLHSSGQYVHYSILRTTETQGWQSPFLEITKKFNDTFRKVDTYTPDHGGKNLTTREKQVLDLLDAGMNTTQIADALSVSTFTIRNHKSSLFKKAKAKTSLQAVSNARKWQWL